MRGHQPASADAGAMPPLNSPPHRGERGKKGEGRLVRMTTNERRPTGVICALLPVPLSLLSPSFPTSSPSPFLPRLVRLRGRQDWRPPGVWRVVA